MNGAAVFRFVWRLLQWLKSYFLFKIFFLHFVCNCFFLLELLQSSFYSRFFLTCCVQLIFFFIAMAAFIFFIHFFYILCAIVFLHSYDDHPFLFMDFFIRIWLTLPFLTRYGSISMNINISSYQCINIMYSLLLYLFNVSKFFPIFNFKK